MAQRGLAAVIATLAVVAAQALAYPGFLPRVDSLEAWESIALGSGGIKFVAPGLDPASSELPCLDLVIYGPGVQHIDIIRATELPCVEGLTSEVVNRMRRDMTQLAGYIARVPGPGRPAGPTLSAVILHNDRFTEPLEVTPELSSHLLRSLGATFNEAALGRLVYLPTTEVAEERARRWLSDPLVALDFAVLLDENGCQLLVERGQGLEDAGRACERFVRGDVNADGDLRAGDAIRLLDHLFRGSAAEPSCLDAASRKRKFATGSIRPVASRARVSSGVSPEPQASHDPDARPPRPRSGRGRPASQRIEIHYEPPHESRRGP
ncbi:MAG: hypothetical protein HY721_27840 [Planctomycetes bacterium]|nr:hypothetical protein [Planctomycetota bacterium]